MRNDTGNNIEFVCIDVANGYTETFRFSSRLPRSYPTITIMAGSVVTADITEALILAGADIVKAGHRPRQCMHHAQDDRRGLSAVVSDHRMRRRSARPGGHICGDGGCTVPGDVAMAFGGGADFMMLGGMFAAHDELAVGSCTSTAKTYRRFYGMSSDVAIKVRWLASPSTAPAKAREVIPKPAARSNTPYRKSGGLRSTRPTSAPARSRRCQSARPCTGDAADQ